MFYGLFVLFGLLYRRYFIIFLLGDLQCLPFRSELFWSLSKIYLYISPFRSSVFGSIDCFFYPVHMHTNIVTFSFENKSKYFCAFLFYKILFCSHINFRINLSIGMTTIILIEIVSELWEHLKEVAYLLSFPIHEHSITYRSCKCSLISVSSFLYFQLGGLLVFG